MRMRFNLLLCLGLALALVACDESHAPKMGVVDLNRLMRDSVPGKAGLKFIESQQSELQGKLDEIQDRLEKNPADETAMQELQKVYAASQQRIQAEGQNVVGQLFDAIQRTLNTFREKNGYSALIRSEALDSYDPALDVTNAVMAEVDKLNIDFKSVLQPEKNDAVPDNGPAGAESGAADKKADADAKK